LVSEEKPPENDASSINKDKKEESSENGAILEVYDGPHLASIITVEDHDHDGQSHATRTRSSTRAYTAERFDVEQALATEKSKSIVITPTKTADGTILVDWYTTDDPANPQNWPASRKSFVLLQLAAYSMAVYGASSMYVPGEQGVMEKFHVGPTPAALGLAIYVLGYGIGPLLFAPLSEIAIIGRNWVYAPTFFIFVILSIPTAVVDNYAGLLVLRFLTGFFGSPCLANGGGTVGDMVRQSSLYKTKKK
jgi:MFS transporter, DHA1 family, multidrug resistance protein